MAEISYTSASKPQSPGQTITAGGGGSAVGALSGTPRSRRNHGSKIKMDHGERKMKAYPITDTELRLLNWTSFVSALCFSLASGMLGFYISTEQAIAFAGSVDHATIERWKIYQTMACFTGITFVVGGIGSVLFGQSMKNQIRKETSFE